MATDVRTMNLSDNGDGMVSLNDNQGTSFVPNIPPEKNVSENKQTMDSTSISDIMGQAEEPLEPPMMSADPRMTQMHMQALMKLAVTVYPALLSKVMQHCSTAQNLACHHCFLMA